MNGLYSLSSINLEGTVNYPFATASSACFILWSTMGFSGSRNLCIVKQGLLCELEIRDGVLVPTEQKGLVRQVDKFLQRVEKVLGRGVVGV
jgi:hypothetical protein